MLRTLSFLYNHVWIVSFTVVLLLLFTIAFSPKTVLFNVSEILDGAITSVSWCLTDQVMILPAEILILIFPSGDLSSKVFADCAFTAPTIIRKFRKNILSTLMNRYFKEFR